VKKNILLWAVRGSAAAAVVAFFLPWASVDVDMAEPVGFFGRQMDKLAGTRLFEGLADTLTAAPRAAGARRTVALSGFDLARQGRSRVAGLVGDLVTLFGSASKDPRRVVYLWGVPAAAALLGLAVEWGWGRSARLGRIAGGAALAVAAFMAWKLLTVSFSNEFARVGLLPGIWVTCGAFFAIGALGLRPKGR
jgi:hypothetical protein